MYRVDLKKDDLIWSGADNLTLRVNATGQILHAYVNGKYLGSQWARYDVFNYVFEEKVKLKPGKNLIALLSATVGFQNYGAFFDLVKTGISGPVEIVGRKGDETITKDLSSHKWSYKVGMHGFARKLYDPKSPAKWDKRNVPTNRKFTWYKVNLVLISHEISGPPRIYDV